MFDYRSHEERSARRERIVGAREERRRAGYALRAMKERRAAARLRRRIAKLQVKLNRLADRANRLGARRQGLQGRAEALAPPSRGGEDTGRGEGY